MIPTYRPGNTPVHSLSVGSMLAYCICSLLSVMMINNPLLLLAGLLVIAVVFHRAGSISGWLWYLKIFSLMVLVYILLNTIFSNQGTHELPLFRWVTWEEMVFGASFAGKLILSLSVFVLFSLTVHPDRMLRVLQRRALRSAVALSIAFRLLPTVVKDTNNIYEAQVSRGISLDRGAWPVRWMKRIGLTGPLLSGSLERCATLAESMECRGFGSDGGIRRPRGGQGRRIANHGTDKRSLAVAGISISTMSVIFLLTEFGGFGLRNSYTTHISLGIGEGILLFLLIIGIASPAVATALEGGKK